MKTKRKILISAHHPEYFSGFANVARNIGLQLLAAGHDVEYVDIAAVQIQLKKERFKVHNKRSSYKNRGKDAFILALDLFKPHIVLTIGDPWDHYYVPQIRRDNKFFWISYVPIETSPLEKNIQVEVVDELKNGLFNFQTFFKYTDKIIAYNEFGKQTIKPHVDKEIDVIHHGVDTKLYRPHDVNTSKIWPDIHKDTFTATTICRNNNRKGLDLMLIGWGKFIKNLKHDEKAALYLHVPKESSGWNLDKLAYLSGSENTILINRSLDLDKPMPENKLANILASTDIYLNTSKGEGFGLPILEATASGCKALVVDYAGPKCISKELSCVATIDVAEFFIDSKSYSKNAIINTHDMSKKLMNLYKLRIGNDRDMNHTKTKIRFDWSVIGQKWIKLVDSIKDENLNTTKLSYVTI